LSAAGANIPEHAVKRISLIGGRLAGHRIGEQTLGWVLLCARLGSSTEIQCE